jgi:hypothetical protein
MSMGEVYALEVCHCKKTHDLAYAEVGNVLSS